MPAYSVEESVTVVAPDAAAAAPFQLENAYRYASAAQPPAADAVTPLWYPDL